MRGHNVFYENGSAAVFTPLSGGVLAVGRPFIPFLNNASPLRYSSLSSYTSSNKYLGESYGEELLQVSGACKSIT